MKNHDCNVSGNSNAISREHSKEINKSQNVYSPHWFSYISFDDSCENLVVYQDIITKLMIFLLNFPGHICKKNCQQKIRNWYDGWKHETKLTKQQKSKRSYIDKRQGCKIVAEYRH